jgi:hypothetical protein
VTLLAGALAVCETVASLTPRGYAIAWLARRRLGLPRLQRRA